MSSGKQYFIVLERIIVLVHNFPLLFWGEGGKPDFRRVSFRANKRKMRMLVKLAVGVVAAGVVVGLPAAAAVSLR